MARGPRILAVGEVLWDCFGPRAADRRLGGAPFNFAYYAAILGADAAFVSAVGTDPLGRDIIHRLKDVSGAASASRQAPPTRLSLHIQRDAKHPTGVVRVTVDTAGNPTFRILRRRAWDYLSYTPTLGRLAARADLICFGTLAQRSPRSRRTIRRLMAETSGVRLCDLNFRPPFVDPAVVRYSLEAADVLKLNDDEFTEVRRMLSLPSGRLRAARRLMREFAINLVCVTRGERGCWLTDGTDWVSAPADSITVVDTVGAGDAFAASLAVDYLARRNLATMASNANRLGGIVASNPGAIVPRAALQVRTRAGPSRT